MIKRIHHIAIGITDMDAALSFWRDALGLELAQTEAVPEQQAQVAFLPAGEGEVELVKPTTETSGMAKYIAKRGPGIHHICLEVDSVEETLARLKARGIRLIDETPRIGSGGKKYAFVHPEGAGGVLVELYELMSPGTGASA
jgi:methylmalonyl-CoA/ethylmalonyl-CoA epimerase